MKITNSRKAGFTLVEIMIVVAIIGLLASIAVPNFVRARSRAQTDACLNTLRQIDAAKQQWALENGKTPVDTPQWIGAADTAIQPYMGRGGLAGSMSAVFCPLNPPVGGAPNDPSTSYTMNQVGVPPKCLKEDPIDHPAIYK
jgi:prepilin-type N-terminal cleavage/methylation domain-containing protein